MLKWVLAFFGLMMAGCGGVPAPAEPALFPLTKAWLQRLDEPLSAPLATDGIRIFAPSTDLQAFDRATGATAWTRRDLTGVLTASPGILVVRSESGAITALDPATGQTRWAARGSSGSSVLPAVLDGARVLVAGSRLVALDATNGRLLAEGALASAAVTPPVLARGRLLLGLADGALVCLDAGSFGVLWSFPMSRPLEAAPAVDGRRVIVGAADRRVLALRLDRGTIEWSFPIGAAVVTTPVLTRHHALVASKEAVLYAFGLGNGHISWVAPLPSRAMGPPVVVGSKALVVCHPDDVLGFDLATGKPAGEANARIDSLDASIGISEVRGAPVVLPPHVVIGLRNPWAVVALGPGSAPKAPSPPAPFPPDPADEL